MKQFVALLLVCPCFLIFSCQKDISLRGNDVDSTGSGLLSKIVYTYIPDNLDYFTSEFEYDTNDRLICRTNTSKVRQVNGSIVTTTGTMQFFRDYPGRVVRIGSRPDTASLNFIVSYETPTSLRIMNTRLIKTSASGTEMTDSVVYSYNSDNRVVREDHYNRMTVADPILLNSYQLFTYDSRRNITRRESFGRNTSTNQFEAPIAFEFEYDDKPNPVYHSDIGILMTYMWEFSSPNNVTKQRNVYSPLLQMPDEEHLYHYLYDNLARPVQMGQNGASDWKLDFYYYP